MTRAYVFLPLLLLLACGAGQPGFPVEAGDSHGFPGSADAAIVESAAEPLKLAVPGDAVGAIRGRKVWAEIRESAAPGRKPRGYSAGELRFLSYDAVLNGASGLWYARELSTSSAAIIGEMRAMAPIFSRGRRIVLPFEPPAEGWTARGWTYHGRDYLILANRTGDRQWKVPAAALEPAWRPLFESRRDPRELLKEHLGSHYLRPYQVLVLESRLRPLRLLGR